jgi:hypothetical protein
MGGSGAGGLKIVRNRPIILELSQILHFVAELLCLVQFLEYTRALVGDYLS